MSPLENVISLLRRRIGLEADSIGHSTIEWAVRERMAARKISELADYAGALGKDLPEQTALIEKVVISETWFFREPAAFETLEGLVRTKWFKAAPLSRLRLLSLPCATGEEPYSMMMALLRAGMNPASIQVDALDVSLRVLESAHAGVFSKHSFRGSALDYREQFFTPKVDGRYAIDEKVRSHVRFEQGNILEPPAWLLARHYDIIFCRNLLIYLDTVNRHKAIAVLRRLLKPSGLIFVGHAEIQEMVNRGFERHGEAKAFALRIPSRAEAKKSRPSNNQPTTEGKTSAPSRPKSRTLAREPKCSPRASTSGGGTDFQELSRLANQGDYAEAAALCDRLLRAAPASAEAHFWLGVIRHAQAQSEQAEEAFRKAIYLDPDHCQALVHLALLLESRGDRQNANLLRRRAERSAPVSS